MPKLLPGESIRKKAEKWGAPNKLIIEPGHMEGI